MKRRSVLKWLSVFTLSLFTLGRKPKDPPTTMTLTQSEFKAGWKKTLKANMAIMPNGELMMHQEWERHCMDGKDLEFYFIYSYETNPTQHPECYEKADWPFKG